jgi:deaminated glutathione amidase
MTKIALLQMTSGIDPAENAAIVTTAIADAAAQGAKILFTPEMTGLLDRDKPRLAKNARPADMDLTLQAAQKGAREFGLWVHIGSLPIPAPENKFYNRGFLISSTGDITATYDKIHMFDVTLPNGDVYHESNSYVAGTRVVSADIAPIKLGLTICYDVRFPYLFRDLAQNGATVIAVPAAFTAITGAAHWHALLRARAIETGAWIVAAAQSGHHADGRETYGHSLVINPWGEIILDMATESGLGFATLDLAQVTKARAQIPAWTTNMPYEIIL